jgi:hypothetical protein
MREGATHMREIARRTYMFGTWVMLVLIVVQFIAAGGGLFSAMAQDSSAGNILQYHRAIGPLAVLVVSLLLVLAGFLGRLPWRMTALAASFFPLLVLQSVLIIPYAYPDDVPALAGMPWLASLHVANALFMFWLAFQWPAWTRRDLAALAGNSNSQSAVAIAGQA